MQGKRTRGNNYSGARWAFAKAADPKREPKPSGDGMTMMGGSNRKTSVWRDEDLKGAVEPHVDNDGHEVHDG